MVLNIHLDASYIMVPISIAEPQDTIFGSISVDVQPIRPNGAIHTLCTILKFIATSSAEAELGTLFLNVKKAEIIKLL